MRTEQIQGFGNIYGGEYERIKIEGVSKCKGDIKAEIVDIEGIFKSKGKIQTKEFFCEGVGEFEKSIKAGKVDIEGIIRMKGNAKLQADNIKCEGVLISNAEICADTIDVDGCIQAVEVTGDNIRVMSRKKSFVSKVPFDLSKIFGDYWFTNKNQNSNIELVEATTIELQGVKAKEVNGENITIGMNCDIEAVDCSGTLYLHPSSRIGKITGGAEPLYKE